MNEDGAWIKHKKPSKHKGALAFNKSDQDSIANPKNKSIVPMRGINKNWGLAEAMEMWHRIQRSSIK